jgi:predicted nucleic acid-binding protein
VAALDATTIAICDAGPLIHLEELGCLDVLRDFAEVRVAEAVWQEVRAHQPSALRRRSVKLQRMESAPDAEPELIELAHAFLLHGGEIESLQLMPQSPDAMLLTDDAAARLVAEQLGYEVHGTIGIVVRAIRTRQRTKRQVVNLLRSIPLRSTLFIQPRLLASIIQQVEES